MDVIAFVICLGESPGFAPRIIAATPAICGAAADVPENRAQPSLDEVPSVSGSVDEGWLLPTSIWQPGGSGSMMYLARGSCPTSPHTVGTVTFWNHGLTYQLA